MCGEPGDELTWPVQITVAGGSPTWVFRAVAQVRRALAGKFLDERSGRLREDPDTNVPIQVDPDVNPRRWFVPLTYRIETA